jgi:hypothetical protein
MKDKIKWKKIVNIVQNLLERKVVIYGTTNMPNDELSGRSENDNIIEIVINLSICKTAEEILSAIADDIIQNSDLNTMDKSTLMQHIKKEYLGEKICV